MTAISTAAMKRQTVTQDQIRPHFEQMKRQPGFLSGMVVEQWDGKFECISFFDPQRADKAVAQKVFLIAT